MGRTKERIIEQPIQRTSYIRRLTLQEKRCPVCQKTFWGAKVKRYCSRACQNRANYERHAEEYRQERRAHYRAEQQTRSTSQKEARASSHLTFDNRSRTVP